MRVRRVISRQRTRWRRVAAALTSALVLLITGYGWAVYRAIDTGLTRSSALGDEGSEGHGTIRSADGSTNILVMGLDSRLDQNGEPLPTAVLEQLHAGDSGNGGYNTNVLMVVHLPAADGPVSAISIPRDDYVQLPGHPDGVRWAKIKEGYGLAKSAAERTLRARGVTDRRQLELQGREAGRRQTVASVRHLLGIHVDHFVEVTLAGFYDLAEALGPVTVCLTGPTQDSYSGARFDAGLQRLDAAQALAFVRQRRDYVHPELNFTDLDRARRQQAFLASLGAKLRDDGLLTDPAVLRNLVAVAQRDVVIDDSLNLLDLLGQGTRLLSDGLSLTTLPVRGFAHLHGADVNLVDPDQIRAAVRASLGPAASAPGPDDAAESSGAHDNAPLPSAVLDVVNASGRDHLAAALLTDLARRGLTRGRATTERQLAAHTYIRYAPDTADTATALTQLLRGEVPAQADPTVPVGHLVVRLGLDWAPPDGFTDSASTPAAGPVADHAGTAPVAPTNTIEVHGVTCVK